MMIPGGFELVLVVGIILLLFGAAKIPKLAYSIGQAQGEFEQARQQYDDEQA